MWHVKKFIKQRKKIDLKRMIDEEKLWLQTIGNNVGALHCIEVNTHLAFGEQKATMVKTHP